MCHSHVDLRCAIDARIFVFIAGAIPLGVAMQMSGTTNFSRAGCSGRLAAGLSYRFSWFCLRSSPLSLSSCRMRPLLHSLCPSPWPWLKRWGPAPEPFVVTVAMASDVAFLTPIGHHENLLVYGPGRYKFSDFVKVGTPLAVILWKG